MNLPTLPPEPQVTVPCGLRWTPVAEMTFTSIEPRPDVPGVAPSLVSIVTLLAVTVKSPVAGAVVPDEVIDGYDDLPATEVIALLGRLPHADLTLIRDYESAGRGRTTILHRIDALLTEA